MNAFEKVMDHLTLIEVVEEYTPVINRGNYYVAKCPFHREKSPSLSINNEKGVYYCFGCMASGNMFTFVQNIDNLSKKESLEKLAAKAGVSLDEPKQNDEMDLAFRTLDTVSNLFQKALEFYQKSDNYVSQYIKDRKLTSTTVSNFDLGYAPNSDFLINWFKKNNISLDIGVDIGVINLKDGRYKDKFVDRLVIPIQNESGRIVGFTARIFPNDTSGRPKYLNSPDSKYFNKSKILYGLNKSKNAISKSKEVILVEGNMDVIMAHQYNFENTIATQGTATTKEHIDRIKRLNSSLILAFDNDNAGRISEYKIAKMAYDQDIDTFKIIIDQKYKDIDEYLLNTNITKFNQIPYIEYAINSNNDLNSKDLPTQRNAISNILNLTNLANPITRAQTLNLINNITHLDIETLKQIQTDTVLIEKKVLPEANLDPIKVQFFQLLALSPDNLNLPIIYKILKDKLDYNTIEFQDFIAQPEIKWTIEGEKMKYAGLESIAKTAELNLIQNLNRLYSKNPSMRILLQQLKIN